MAKVIKIIKNEVFFVLFFSFLLLGLSFAPTIYESFEGQKLGDLRRVFLWGEHNYTYDYNVYLSRIRQGAEGRWTVINKYTTEPHSGSFLHEFYLLSGKIGRFFGLSPVLTYHFLRLFLGVAVLLLIWLTGEFFFNSSSVKKAFFLLALFFGSFPKFYYYQGWRVTLFFDWWQELDQIKRATYVPHYLFGYLSTLIILLSFLNFLKTKNKKWFFLSLVFGFLVSFVHPPNSIISLGILGFLFLENLLKQKNFKNAPYFLIFFLLVAVPLCYIQWMTKFYPWKSIVDFDRTYPWLYSLKELILAYGINLPLGIAGGILVLKKRQEKFYPFVYWLATALLIFVFFKITHWHSELYFIQTNLQIPLAALSVVFLSLFFSKVLFLSFFLLLLSLPGIYASLSGQFQFIKEKVAATLPLVPYPPQVMYPLKDWWEAIEWLEKNTNNQQAVLSDITAGNYIPAYAGNVVWLGHPAETVFYEVKRRKMIEFFSGAIREKEAWEFLKENSISFIFYGPQEKSFGYPSYSFLKPVFESEYVTIYQVGE